MPRNFTLISFPYVREFPRSVRVSKCRGQSGKKRRSQRPPQKTTAWDSASAPAPRELKETTMKKQTYMIIAAIMLATVAGLSTAQAQNANTNLAANIPFDFSVGNKTLPAGEYIVTSVNPASSVKVLQIRSKSGTASAMVRTDSVNGKLQDNARLVFYRHGDQYFFAQAWMAAEGIGMQAPRAKALKALELAGEKRTTQTVLARAAR